MNTLVTIPFSHFCEKARWALDHAAVLYREEGHAPVLHKIAVRRLSGNAGSVPILVLDEGGVLDDSPLIVRWADAQAADDRRLLPPLGAARDEAVALEHHLDTEFAPHVRRAVYALLLEQPAMAKALFGARVPRAEAALARAAFPLVRAALRRAMRVHEPHVTASRDRIRRVFDAMAARLADGRPFLMGDHFGAVDIAFAAFASPLVRPEQHRSIAVASLPAAVARQVDAFRGTPAGAFALRMYRDHRRSESAAPPGI